VTNTGHWY